ncbi:hypothetical protein ACE6H2_006643 [Prunus campanulata]
MMIELSSPPSPSSPSSTSSPSSSFTQSWTYDVFLSFRGEDTRKTFTDHLYTALDRLGIHTFIDDELPRGEEISPQLLKAIEDSKISIIVFSENYASSRWCLDELVKILECKKSKGHMVMPIFYKVDPSDVRKQTSKFGDAFEGLIERKFKDNEEKVLIWKKALIEAGNLSGLPFREGGYEAKFIKEVVEEILVQVLNNTYLDGPTYPVGIKSRVTDVNKLLSVDDNGHCTVGIWGTAGIGKTTIAKAVYNSIASKFEGCCFLTNVREKSSGDGLLKLQEALLCQVLGGKNFQLFSLDHGINVIQQLLSRKRILLILDDVNHSDQLHNLARVGWFGEGSRVVVTTRDKGLLTRHGIELIYEVKQLDDQDALELLSRISFKRKEPPDDFLGLAWRAIACAQYLPLALTILGSYLRNQSTEYWHATLHSYEADPFDDIQKILRTSYGGLKYNVQQVFLDIACFFKGENLNYVVQVLKGPKLTFPDSCIKVLLENAIITVDGYNRIQMHDLLEEMGKNIVHEESPKEPGKRSRLWFHEDVREVLAENYGTSKVKGIMTNLPKHDEIPLNAESFSGMKNLEFFINRNARLSGDAVDYLSDKLRVFVWGNCQLQYLPSNFRPKELVEFSMPCSRIRRLEQLKHSTNLTSMNLRGCQSLEKIPDLSGIPNIKYLILSECTSLVEVDDSVGLLDKLVGLYLNQCVKLTRFGTRLRLKSLEELDLSYCKMLESFPEIEVKMESLETLNISRSGVRKLPLSIAYLTGLKVLKADFCGNLTGLSQVSSINSELQLLPKLSRFSLMGSNLLKSNFLLPLYCWSTLVELDLSVNNFFYLPISFSKLVNLENLDLGNCKSLLEIPEQVLPPRVRYVKLDNCTSLVKIPKLAWVWLEKIPEISPGDKLELSLINCFRLRGNDITENIFLNQASVSSPHSHFDIYLPGDDEVVPKWFSCRKDATLVKVKEEYEAYHPKNKKKKREEYEARCEVSFEIPPNLKWESLRLVLCTVTRCDAKILLNRKLVNLTQIGLIESHVRLTSIPLLGNAHMFEEPLREQSNTCRVILHLSGEGPTPVKIPYGVHLIRPPGANISETSVVDHGPTQLLPDAMAGDDDILGKRPCELLSLSLVSKTSLGKRPRESNHCANVVDIGDHEAQWLTVFTGPTDHQKRRHIDPNEEPKYKNPACLNHVKLLQLNCRIFDNPAKDTKWDLEQLKLQDEKFDGQR